MICCILDDFGGGKWSCVGCIFENKFYNFKCEICGYEGIVEVSFLEEIINLLGKFMVLLIRLIFYLDCYLFLI